jgi:predicted lipoprotein with Yx(FWY)xxD motif
MKTPSAATAAVLGAMALLAAGCGSSKKTTNSTASAAASNARSSQSSNAGYPGTTTSSSAATSTGSPATTITAKHLAKLGEVLAAGPRRMTVYLFEADKGPASKCTEACASAWPPVTTSGTPAVSGAAMSAHLGTIKRADGTTQVTYNGHPLYYFVRDKDSGDAYGQGVHGFGASWYVLSPSGAKIDMS